MDGWIDDGKETYWIVSVGSFVPLFEREGTYLKCLTGALRCFHLSGYLLLFDDGRKIEMIIMPGLIFAGICGV